MTENKIIKNLLCDCKIADEIETILLEYHNINIEEGYWLEKYNLIKSRYKYNNKRIKNLINERSDKYE